jgi:glycosyltransferase involved in cell wall biosynthesis
MNYNNIETYEKMKKLLLISHDFPPIHSVESVRSFKFAKYLFDYGIESEVICAAEKEKTSIEGINIHTVFSPDNSLLRAFELYTGLDGKFLWISSAVKAGKKLLNDQKIDVILSRSTPRASHMVAYELKSASGIPWIADFSDPWTQNVYIKYPFGFIKKHDESLEKKVVHLADRIVFTSERTKDLFLTKYMEIPESKVRFIPNFYDTSDFQEIKIPHKHDKCTFVHAGSFYNMRSPEPFLKGLKLLASEIDISGIKVKLVGNMKGFENLIKKYDLENIVEITGIVPREEAHRHLLEADILLLIDAPSETPSIFLPTKLVDYISMNKPILAITPEGTSADVIHATHTGAVVSPHDIIGIKNCIKNYCELYRTSKLEVSPDAKEINRYTAQQCTKEMHELIEELIN